LPQQARAALAVVACAAAAISGFVALVYEVAWTRLLVLIVGPTTYAFATVAVTAVAASASAWFAASRLPLTVASQVADPGASFGRVVTVQAFGIVILLLPTTCALGAVFPLALAAASTGQATTVGRDVARVYAANTCGAIAGSLVGGFVLLPYAGLEITFRLAAITGLVAALGIWAVEIRGQRVAWRHAA